MSTLDTGKKVVQAFHSAARSVNGSVPSSYPEFENLIRRTYFPRDVIEAPQGYTGLFYPKAAPSALMDTFYDGLGVAAESLNKNDTSIAYSMRQLAQAGGGEIPANRNAFFWALRSEPILTSFFDMASFVAVETAKDITTGAQKLGNELIQGRYLVYAAVLGGIVLMLRNFGGKAGMGFGAMAKSFSRSNPKKRKHA